MLENNNSREVRKRQFSTGNYNTRGVKCKPRLLEEEHIRFINSSLSYMTFIGICSLKRYIPEINSYRFMLRIDGKQDSFVTLLKSLKYATDKIFVTNQRWVSFGAGDGRNVFIDVPQLKFGRYYFKILHVDFTEKEVILRVLTRSVRTRNNSKINSSEQYVGNGLPIEKTNAASRVILLGENKVNQANGEVMNRKLVETNVALVEVVPRKQPTTFQEIISIWNSTKSAFVKLRSYILFFWDLANSVVVQSKPYIFKVGRILFSIVCCICNGLHTLWHMRTYPYCCIYCRFKYEYNKITGGYQTKKKALKCPHCNYQNKYVDVMRKHIEQEHERKIRVFKFSHRKSDYNKKNHYRNSDKMKNNKSL